MQPSSLYLANFHLLPPLLTGGAFLCDNSSFESIFNCERSAFFKLLCKREWNGDQTALNFGSAVHAALEARYKSSEMFAGESKSEQLASGLSSLATRPVESGDWRDESLLREVINQYSLTYPIEDFTILADSTGAPCVELPFAIPLGTITLASPIQLQSKDENGVITLSEYTSIPIIWTGKIDLVVKYQSRNWLADHKSTSIFGPKYFDQYEISGQFSGYAWAVQTILNEPVAGVGINVIALRKPTKTGKGIEFGRRWISIPQYQIAEWQMNTLNLLANFFAMMHEGNFPMRTTSCVNKWGRKCDYHGVCVLPEPQRMMYLSTGDYKNKTWSPLED